MRLTDDTLRALLLRNHFPVPGDGILGHGIEERLVIVALRGALPASESTDWRERRGVELVATDRVHPRCTLVQWDTARGLVALYPGSTVPHERYVSASLRRNGRGANQLLTGFYEDYQRGIHRAGRPTGHAALRQTSGRPHRRTADDLDYDADDRVEYGNPYDNLHAAWSMGPDHAYFASAGCLVVCGYPACSRRGQRPNSGPWADFIRRVEEADQDRYPTALLPARSLLGTGARLRFGSRGALVGGLQEALAAAGHYDGPMSGRFGPQTLSAVLAFQTEAFGPDADDGVVGPQTAGALGLALT